MRKIDKSKDQIENMIESFNMIQATSCKKYIEEYCQDLMEEINHAIECIKSRERRSFIFNLGQSVLDTKNPLLNYDFAFYVEGADIIKHSEIVCQYGDYEQIKAFEYNVWAPNFPNTAMPMPNAEQA